MVLPSLGGGTGGRKSVLFLAALRGEWSRVG